MIRLYLDGNGLFGEIPEELFTALQYLRHLHLRNNSLAGSLPSAMPIAGRLITLDFSENFLSSTIPAEIGHIQFLNVLRLGSNALYGTVPDDLLINHYDFRELNLTRNALTGPILTQDQPEYSSRWAHLGSLEVLDLSHNGFTGEITSSIFRGLERIKVLDISRNSFTGSLPLQVAEDLQSINSFKANGNQLTGSFPWSLFSHFNLVHIDMSDNLFTSGLTFDAGRFTFTLEYLDFSNNRIQSTMPGVLGELTNLKQLILNDNKIFGSLPDSIANMAALEVLDISRNTIGGRLSPLLANCQGLTELYLHGNQFTGDVPVTFSQLSSLREYRDIISVCDSGMCSKPQTEFILSTVSTGRATFHDNEIAGDIDFLCSSHSAAASTTRSITNVTDVEGDFARVISADCSGDSPQVVCTSCCECS